MLEKSDRYHLKLLDGATGDLLCAVRARFRELEQTGVFLRLGDLRAGTGLGQDGGIERARRAGMDEAVGYDEVLGTFNGGW